MCGIIGYIGKQQAKDILLGGLRKLEYRGYDSAGIFLSGIHGGRYRSVGDVSQLSKAVAQDIDSTCGIGHTRWATHGGVTIENAHPHVSNDGKSFVVHNGIIENYHILKKKLIGLGYSFKSETDTEVVAHLMQEYKKQGKDFEEAFRAMCDDIIGAYALVVADADVPDKILVARMGSPLVIGLGDGETFVASDITPLIQHTRDVMYLEDGDMAVCTSAGVEVKSLETTDEIERMINTIDVSIEDAEKEGYEHFMMKEMMEAPQVIADSIRGRLILEDSRVKLGGLELVEDELQAIEELVIVACGSSYYSGVVGRDLIEDIAGIPVKVEIASELRYRKFVANKKTAFLFISQSGETADTLEVLRMVKKKGFLTLGIVNAVGSTIARETDAGVYCHIGPEVAVASTKAFLSQMSILLLVGLFLGEQRSLGSAKRHEIVTALSELPFVIQGMLPYMTRLQDLAEKYSGYKDMLFIGRGTYAAIAAEGALKLKEVSYIHAEAYPGGEMKHGPLALIDENFPTFAIAPHDHVYEKMTSNIREIQARGGKVIMMTTAGHNVEIEVDEKVIIPKTHRLLQPIIATIPLQFFAYYCAEQKGLNVDRPRNLAKSVTVE